jgi:DNA-binding MarR family transcriptional regulator
MSIPLDVKLLDIERVAEERIRVKCSGDDGRMGGDRDGVDGIVEQWARERPDLDTTAMAVFGRVLRLARLAGDETSRVYDGFGLGRPEFDVLATLRRAGEPYALSPGALAASMMMSSGGTTARLDKLRERRPRAAPPDPARPRALLVRLTEGRVPHRRHRCRRRPRAPAAAGWPTCPTCEQRTPVGAPAPGPRALWSPGWTPRDGARTDAAAVLA